MLVLLIRKSLERILLHLLWIRSCLYAAFLLEGLSPEIENTNIPIHVISSIP